MRQPSLIRIGKGAYDYLSPHPHLRMGQACQVISDSMVELGVDLLVMGTVARTGISGFHFGNTAETILEQVKCSTLALKPANFICPVKPIE
jgi:universal stress protein E